MEQPDDPHQARVLTVKKQYLNQQYTVCKQLPAMSTMLTGEGFAELIKYEEKALCDQIKMQSLCDHYAQLGWVEVSYAGRSVQEISMWVLHHVRGMNINMLHKQCWWFEQADEAAFFKLSWA